MEAIPDLTTLSDADLDKLIEELERRESEVSYERRLLQGKIDILRAERVARKRSQPEGDLPGYNHPRYEPLWEVCEALDMPLHTHGGEPQISSRG